MTIPANVAPTTPFTYIIVPAYNEATRLNVAEVDRYLESTSDVRLLFVNDGSKDSTLQLLQSIAARHSDRVSVLDLTQNQGKAEAVRHGVLKAIESGCHYVGFWDADWATPLAAIRSFVDCLNSHPEVEVVLGARVALLGRSIERKAHRHYLGRVAATFASLVLGLPVYDTQCGAKLFRVSASTKQVFAAKFESGWVFDVELIARYVTASGNRAGLYELPLDTWTDVGESKVRPIDFLRSFGHMARIYRRYRLPQRYHRAVDMITAPFSRYVSAGAIGTAAHYAMLALCVEAFDLQPWFGAAAGAATGALVNYVLNYHFIFATNRPHRETLPKFMVVAALGVAINTMIVRVGAQEFGVHYLVAQLAATVVVLVIGFVLNKVWTFSSQESD